MTAADFINVLNPKFRKVDAMSIYETTSNSDPSVTLKMGSQCYLTYPCKHSVTINSILQDRYWSATQIIQWCDENNSPYPQHVLRYTTN